MIKVVVHISSSHQPHLPSLSDDIAKGAFDTSALNMHTTYNRMLADMLYMKVNTPLSRPHSRNILWRQRWLSIPIYRFQSNTSKSGKIVWRGLVQKMLIETASCFCDQHKIEKMLFESLANINFLLETQQNVDNI